MERYLYITAGMTSMLVFMLVRWVVGYHPERIVLRQYEELSGFLREKRKYRSWYQKTEQRLQRNGATFHYGTWIKPSRYLLLKILLAAAGAFILGSVWGGMGMLCAVMLFFLPDWLLVYLNKSDNLRMLPEIKLIYHALEIQIRAGVYVTDALAECYGSVREKRLQQALLDLAGQIVMKSDIYDALDCFQRKFDNRHIDALCITILQACESGQAVELLGDIGEQLKDMETAVMNGKKNSLDRSITFYQLGMLVAVLLVVVYACVSYMFTEAVKL